MARAEAYLHAKFHLDPSNRLAMCTNVADRTVRQTDRQTDRTYNGLIAQGEPFYKRSPKKSAEPPTEKNAQTADLFGPCVCSLLLDAELL